MATSPLRLTLQGALARAQANSVEFQAAVNGTQPLLGKTASRRAKRCYPYGRLQQWYVGYTQGNGAGGVRYIANNAVHEYVSQGNIHEAMTLLGWG